MIATFLLSTPRSGSLALSRIFNSSLCLAHHEGNDYSVLNKKNEQKFSDTFAGCLYKQAIEEGKNYFCCDVSCAFELAQKFENQFEEMIRSKKIKFRLLCIDRKPIDILQSFDRLGFQFDPHDQLVFYNTIHKRRLDMISYINWQRSGLGVAQTMTATFDENVHIGIASEETGNQYRFNTEFLSVIAEYTGAIDFSKAATLKQETRQLITRAAIHHSLNYKQIQDKGIRLAKEAPKFPY